MRKDLEAIDGRIGEVMERLDETLDRGKPRTAGAECYRSLAALRADLRASLGGSADAPYGGDDAEKHRQEVRTLRDRVGDLRDAIHRLSQLAAGPTCPACGKPVDEAGELCYGCQ